MDNKRKRAKPAWVKLIVDGKTLFVFAKSRVPTKVKKMDAYVGIDLRSATKDERKPYIKKEFYHKQKRNYT